MSDWVLDEDRLNAAHEAALLETRRRLRVMVDEALDELGVSDPERREAFHSRALQLTMPFAREVYGRDVAQMQELARAPSTVQH